MLKIKVLFMLVFFISMSLSAQETIKIVFNNQSTGDYDLIIRDILNDNGYDAFVEYKSTNRAADFTIKYEDSAKENVDELQSYKLVLYNSAGKKVNEVVKKLPYWSFGLNEPKQMCKGLSSLLSKKFDCKYKEEEEVKYFNISFGVHKMDSASYAIVAMGAGIRSLEDVEEAFLKKGGEYLSSFEYYVENGQHKYAAPGPVTTHHSGKLVYGIIKGTTDAKGSRHKLEEKPVEFLNKFETY